MTNDNSATHIELPAGLPQPPAPPNGYKWEARGFAWKTHPKRICFIHTLGGHRLEWNDFSHCETFAVGGKGAFYLEAVKQDKLEILLEKKNRIEKEIAAAEKEAEDAVVAAEKAKVDAEYDGLVFLPKAKEGWYVIEKGASGPEYLIGVTVLVTGNAVFAAPGEKTPPGYHCGIQQSSWGGGEASAEKAKERRTGYWGRPVYN